MSKFITKKSLGQHFLTNQVVISNIIYHAGNLSDKTVIEIGPGNGALTENLIKIAKHVIAIEKDQRLEPFLALLKQRHTNFDYIIADALYFDPDTLPYDNKILISNLPYNIGTQILLNYLLLHRGFKYFILMFQLEVAKRIISTVGDSNYGRLSIISQLLSDTEFLLEVDEQSFSPPPKVKSAVLKITPLVQPRIDVNINTLEHIVKNAFGQRRKILNNSLSTFNFEFDKLGINGKQRAEELSLEQFCLLANNLANIH